MLKDKKTFFERLANTISVEEEDELEPVNFDQDDDFEDEEFEAPKRKSSSRESEPKRRSVIQEESFVEEEEEEGELSVDVYQTNNDIIVEAMIAGVKPEDLHLNITRDMITIKGKRDGNSQVDENDYFYRELYWGPFSRTILLPSEVDIEQAEAVEKHGLLIIRMPKLDKSKHAKLKVKSI